MKRGALHLRFPPEQLESPSTVMCVGRLWASVWELERNPGTWRAFSNGDRPASNSDGHRARTSTFQRFWLLPPATPAPPRPQSKRLHLPPGSLEISLNENQLNTACGDTPDAHRVWKGTISDVTKGMMQPEREQTPTAFPYMRERG